MSPNVTECFILSGFINVKMLKLLLGQSEDENVTDTVTQTWIILANVTKCHPMFHSISIIVYDS